MINVLDVPWDRLKSKIWRWGKKKNQTFTLNFCTFYQGRKKCRGVGGEWGGRQEMSLKVAERE